MSAVNIEWNDAYSLGIDLIDREHKKLFEIVGKIFVLQEQHDVKEKIREILYELSEYIQQHFHDEEAYMKRIGYPELEYHKKLHEKIVSSVSAIVRTSDRIDIIQTKMRVIAKRALIDHILEEDMKIKLFQATVEGNKNIHVKSDGKHSDDIMDVETV